MRFKIYVFYLIILISSLFSLYFIKVSHLQVDQTRFDIIKLNRTINSVDNAVTQILEKRGGFWVLYNFVLPSVTCKYDEAVTYTTHGDYSFLDNLETLALRWNNPISLALYAPGDDFEVSLKSIAYLRNCRSPKIKEFVTFHVFFDDGHFPEKEGITNSYHDFFNCSEPPPFSSTTDSYRDKHDLSYPINVARNIARVTAQTYFIFPSDIELYPVYNFSNRFLHMISTNPQYLSGENPTVFVVPIFEVTADSKVPSSKTELRKMLKEKTAQLFHLRLCKRCHNIPDMDDWVKLEESDDFHVFTVVKRVKKYAVWEPFYVGTNKEPLFDERFSWEGQKNKMIQAFSMCLLGYDYMVLDNAFLIHKPGIKKSKHQVTKHSNLIAKTNRLVKNVIKPELKKLYGNRSGCTV